jgi:predicted enzyme related to lactoylglutathione lyase
MSAAPGPAPPIRQQVTWVYTRDLDATARFYAETLALPLVLDQGPCRIYRTGASSFLGLCRVRPGRFIEPKGVTITLVTPEVDAWHARLVAAGARVEAPPRHSETFNVYSFFAFDPEGYRIEFQAFRDPRWPAG